MIVRDRKLFVGGYNLSGYIQGASFGEEYAMEDDTCFGDTFRSNTPGLSTFDVQHEGVWSAGTALPDTIFAANKGLADELATITPVDGAEGSIGYFFRTAQGAYSLGGEVGSLHRFSVNLKGSGGYGAIRGTIMVNGTKTSSSVSTIRELGATSATQKLYAGLHVLTVSGTNPTLDVTVKSDALEAFGSPTTLITFAQKTAIGAQWATPVDGAITDTWYRVDWTIGGTATPTFEFVVLVGIQ